MEAVLVFGGVNGEPTGLLSAFGPGVFSLLLHYGHWKLDDSRMVGFYAPEMVYVYDICSMLYDYDIFIIYARNEYENKEIIRNR